jgi:hypothetical protein
MSVLEQLGKHEPRKPPRALEEEDLVRCWSFVHHPVESESDLGLAIAHTTMVHDVSEIAAWENRVRERGWIPAVTMNATREAFFVFGHANPSDPGLERKVAELVAAVNDLNGAQGALSDHVGKLQEVLERRIHLPQ